MKARKTKSTASERTLKRKAERNASTIAWDSSKGTYIIAKHGVWDNVSKTFKREL